MSTVIEKTIKSAIAGLQGSLEYFYPAHGKNGFNERNLTYQFAKAFESRPSTCAFMEVPYHNPLLDKYNKRIDCLAIDPRCAIFVESKRLYNSIKAAEMVKDVARLNKENTDTILTKHCKKKVPSSVYMLLLAETWQPSVVEWWFERPTEITWTTVLPNDLVRKSAVVKQYGKKSLYWLYAYKRIL